MRPEEFTNIPKEKFVLVNENKKLRDKELVTKPVGFFRDAMHRFAKNKGSIVGAVVIGLLVLFALVVPIFSQYTVSYNDTYYRYTLPKLTNSETTDFLDGCTNKTLNETSFIYYYSIGAENGHNAVKRQQYSKGSDGMYTFRLDTYRQVGTIFKTVTKPEYEAIQAYQDEHNVQIIYPITDPNLRPKQNQDRSNANFWFKTKTSGSITVPDEYVVHQDGTIEFTNIYQEYSKPVLDSVSDAQSITPVKLVQKNAGFALSLNSLVTTDAAGNTLETPTYQHAGYLKVYVEDDVNCSDLVESIDDASEFTFDTTLNTLVTYIVGHEESSKNGNHYIALNKTNDTAAHLIHVDIFGSDSYVPFYLYDEGELVTSPVADKYYFFSANRQTYKESNFYIKSVGRGNIIAVDNRNSSLVLTAEAQGDGYALCIPGVGTTKNYIAISANGDNTTINAVNTKTSGSVFKFDATNKAIYTTVNGHTTSSKDGDYYFLVDTDAKLDSSIFLGKASEVDGEKIQFLPLINASDFSEVTDITAGSEYRVGEAVTIITNTPYYINGSFKGDFYHSKMRIEGENNYKYNYAIKKDGANYEIRVCYYEYYIYYHQGILHDRVTSPFFLFGTTANGQDIFTCLASGARFSFAMAIIVAAVNMIVGAIYGAIEGYYGGKVDLIMERVVEILSAVPFMIVITLLKYHMGGTSQALILFIAFFLTGWIGESGTVRMQFYRFKNQEYVLAARTLGAKDWRIMFRHIFPNALGTIVTSSVLVIPGMIFSETSLSYLGIINLNSGSMTSVGTLLANAQPYLVTYPHMILFPAIFISLLMLCFNLFGNGLRDAFNPSLRGTED